MLYFLDKKKLEKSPPPNSIGLRRLGAHKLLLLSLDPITFKLRPVISNLSDSQWAP